VKNKPVAMKSAKASRLISSTPGVPPVSFQALFADSGNASSALEQGNTNAAGEGLGNRRQSASRKQLIRGFVQVLVGGLRVRQMSNQISGKLVNAGTWRCLISACRRLIFCIR
jgi:hypothetical protein